MEAEQYTTVKEYDSYNLYYISIIDIDIILQCPFLGITHMINSLLFIRQAVIIICDSIFSCFI